MVAQRRGHIVTIASLMGSIAQSQVADYCSSKFALVGFDMALRFELELAKLSGFIKTTIVKTHMIGTGMFADRADRYPVAPLDPDSVARRIVTGIRLEELEVVMPSYISAFVRLYQLSPANLAGCQVFGAFVAANQLAR